MNEFQLKTAENLILFLQKNKIIESIDKLWDNFECEQQRDRIVIIESLKKDYQLIEISNNSYLLTKKGKEFTSFDNLFNEEKTEIENNKIEIEKLKLEFKNIKWLYKYRWVAIILALLSFIISIISFWSDYSSNEYELVIERIEKLEKAR
jgi:hypothetical protein